MPNETADETVRRATRDDLDQIVAMAGTGVEEKADQKGGPMWVRREWRGGSLMDELGAAVDAPDHEVAVGLLDGVPLGYGTVRVDVLPDGGRLGVIEDIYVSPEARQVGLGEMLMDHLLEWARQQGCFGVDSLALPGDRSTKNFFESFGLVARAIIVHRDL